MRDEKKGVSKNVILLGIVSFLNDVSGEMVIPILPLFIESLGGAGLAVGLIGGLRDSLSAILRVFAGYWSDRSGKRKPFVFFGYLSSAFLKLLLAFSKVWQHILVFASLERIGKGLRAAPRDAIIADSMPKRRGGAFGIHRAMDTSGGILGSILVFLLFWFLHLDLREIIFAAGIIGLFSLLPLHFVKEKSRQPRDIKLNIGLKGLSSSLRLFIFVSVVFSLANFSYMFFILRAKDCLQGRFSLGVPILLYVLFNIFYALFAIPFGNLSDRLGRKKVLLFGYFLFALTCLGFALANSLKAFLFLFPLYGLVYAIIDGNQRAFVSDLAQDKLRATSLGTFHTATGLATLPASLIAGFLWRFNPSATFIYGMLVSGLASVLLIVFKKRIDII